MLWKIILICVSLIIFTSGIIVLKNRVSKKRNCNKKIKATIVKINEDINEKYTKYSPIIEWEYNEETFKREAGLSSKNVKKYVINDTLKIKINPNMPNEFIIKGKPVLLLGIVLIAIGVTLLIIGVGLL